MPGWMCGCVNLQDTEGGDELQLRITDIAWREMSVVRMRPRMFPGKHPYSGFLKERSTLDVSITHLPVPLWSTDTDFCASARPPPPDQRTSPGFCVCWLLKAHSCFRFPKSCPPADRSHSAPWGLNWQPQGEAHILWLMLHKSLASFQFHVSSPFIKFSHLPRLTLTTPHPPQVSQLKNTFLKRNLTTETKFPLLCSLVLLSHLLSFLYVAIISSWVCFYINLDVPWWQESMSQEYFMAHAICLIKICQWHQP